MKRKKTLWIILSFLLLILAGASLYFFKFYKPSQSSYPFKISAKNPEHFLRGRAETLMKQRYYAPLIATYEKMLQQVPDNSDLQKKLAKAYFGGLQYDKAEPLFEKLSVSDSKDADVWFALGAIAAQKGNSVKAKEDLKKALSLNPQHEAAKKQLGEIE